MKDNYNVDYSQYYYKPKKQKRKVNLTMLIIILIMAGSFLLFMYIISFKSSSSSLIAMNNSRFSITINENLYYAVSFAKTESYDKAEITSETLKVRGGAGYIFENGNSYEVFACIYKTKQQAQSVSTSLIAKGEANQIFEVKIPQKEIKIGFGGKNLECIYDSFLTFYKVVDELLEIVFKLDSDAISANETKKMIASERNDASNVIDSLNDISINTNVVSVITRQYVELFRNLDELKESESTKNIFSGEIKMNTIIILCDFIKMIKELN